MLSSVRISSVANYKQSVVNSNCFLTQLCKDFLPLAIFGCISTSLLHFDTMLTPCKKEGNNVENEDVDRMKTFLNLETTHTCMHIFHICSISPGIPCRYICIHTYIGVCMGGGVKSCVPNWGTDFKGQLLWLG